jgi:serine phosphatase RsbU (regulator of sigma subunit)
MLIRRGGVLECCDATGVPLGLLRDRSYTQESAMLQGGDLLLLFTDGVTEAEGEAKEGEFGLDRVKACFKGAKGSAGLIEKVSNDLGDYLAGSEAKDDVTLLCAWCRPPA